MIVEDEPTASLDPTKQQDILSLFRTVREKFNLSMILITHNPALLAGLADRVLLLYAGKVAGIGPTEKVLASPQHPDTRALLQSMPRRLGEPAKGHKSNLAVIPGDAPNSEELGEGCRFRTRCG